MNFFYRKLLKQSPQCGNIRHPMTDPYYLQCFLQVEVKKRKKNVYFSKFQFANRVTFPHHLLKKVLSLRQYCRSLQNCLSLNKIIFFPFFFLKIINVNRVGWDIGTTYDAQDGWGPME